MSVHEPSVPLKKLTDIGADYAAWADGGKTITWAIGASFFRLPFDSVIFPPLKSEDEDKGEDKEKAEAEKKAQKPKPEEVAVVIEQPRHRPRGTVVLSGAKVITMRGDEVIPEGDIVVTDHRIVAVGAKGSVKVPEGAKVIDVAGNTIVPGFVDTHAHWTEVRRGVLDMQNWSFFANLAYGVTTGRDPQTGTNDMFAYQDLVETGELVGPRAFSTGPGVFSDNDFQSAEDVEAVVARYKKYYRTNTLKSYMIGNRRQREWMVEACRKNEVMPTTEGGLDLKLNLTHALDGFSGNEHSLPVVPLFADVVELFAQDRDLVHADAPGRLWRAVRRDRFLHDDVHSRRPQDPPVHPPRSPGRQGQALGLVSQERACLSPDRRLGGQGRAGRRARLHRQPRRDAGDRLPLGNVGAGERRLAAAGSPPRGHAERRRGDRLRPGPGKPRNRQARRFRRAVGRPAQGHPQHQLGPLCDEKRRAVRGGYSRSDLAGEEAVAATVVVGTDEEQLNGRCLAGCNDPHDGCAAGTHTNRERNSLTTKLHEITRKHSNS